MQVNFIGNIIFVLYKSCLYWYTIYRHSDGARQLSYSHVQSISRTYIDPIDCSVKYPVQNNPSGCVHGSDTDARWLSTGQQRHGDSRTPEPDLRDLAVELRAQRVAGAVHGGDACSYTVQSPAGRAVLRHNC